MKKSEDYCYLNKHSLLLISRELKGGDIKSTFFRIGFRHISICIFTFFILFFSYSTLAQLSTTRCKWVNTKLKEVIVDTLSLQPGSLKVSSIGAEVDYEKNKIKKVKMHIEI